MLHQGLAPGVQQRADPEARPEAFLTELEQRLRGGVEEQRIDWLRVLKCQRPQHRRFGREQPRNQVPGIVLVHQESHRPQLHPEHRPAIPAVLVQGLEHKAIAAERAQHVGIGRCVLGMHRGQCSQRGLRLGRVAGQEGDAGAGGQVHGPQAYRRDGARGLGRVAVPTRREVSQPHLGRPAPRPRAGRPALRPVLMLPNPWRR